MSDEENEQSLEEWMAKEQARLEKGFEYQSKPSAKGGTNTGDDALTGLGLGAAVVGGAVAPHPNPVTFEGVKASVIADALKSDISSDDTQVQINRTDDSTVVTVLLHQARSDQFLPALTVTLLEKAGASTTIGGAP